MSEHICHIVGAGDFYGFDLAPRPGDYVIAADGGLRYLESAGIPADLVIGDFDTLGEVPSHPNVITLSCEKDDTDTLAAVREGIARGYDTFCLHACTGGRIEHTIANTQTLAYLAQNGRRGFLLNKDAILTAVTNGAIAFPAHADGFVSVFSLSDEARGVCISGLKYELDDATLTSAFPIGISNEFIGAGSTISVRSGTLLIVFPKKYKEDILT